MARGHRIVAPAPALLVGIFGLAGLARTPHEPGSRSEQDGHERANLGEPDSLVDGPGGKVEVVDVQGDDGRQRPASELDDRGHPAGSVTAVAQRGRYPYALYLAGVRRDCADLGLEHHLPVLDPG